MAFTQVLVPLAGGALIGLASALMLVLSGRIAGISGIVGGLLTPQAGDVGWRVAFVSALVLGGVLMSVLLPSAFPADAFASVPRLAVAGVVVGFGARLGSGCTSGHGVCGIGRLSPRGIVATLTFMGTGAVTVFVLRHLVGNAG